MGFFHSIHWVIPLSSNISPFDYVLNSAYSSELIAAEFVDQRFPMIAFIIFNSVVRSSCWIYVSALVSNACQHRAHVDLINAYLTIR